MTNSIIVRVTCHLCFPLASRSAPHCSSSHIKLDTQHAHSNTRLDLICHHTGHIADGTNQHLILLLWWRGLFYRLPHGRSQYPSYVARYKCYHPAIVNFGLPQWAKLYWPLGRNQLCHGAEDIFPACSVGLIGPYSHMMWQMGKQICLSFPSADHCGCCQY